ncbi:hypothetical protein Q9R19_05050 [Microbacterium sp. ARD32]|uniref:hypothetical protein n=1 Tax=Microbacterium sp. ARD32 TaxID=2962577 RepID=UPI002880EC73|nr:hypothetical protein [Microbacterium sp. ARD32]MDT0156992.1 hypothetical protein [Microbacterium sp. ARD32]
MSVEPSSPRSESARPRGLRGLLRGFITGIAGLAYGFIIWTAVFYAIRLSTGGMSGYGWLILLLPAAVAVVVFAIVLALTRRRSIGAFVLTLLTGLGLSAVFLLDTFGYVIRNLDALTGS